jgi:glycosyltransferase involved in cell wall biosynthesis
MRVALVHDWLTVYGGAEKVLEQILHLFPQADLFTVVDFFPPFLRKHILEKRVTTTFIQKLPFAKCLYRAYLPLMPIAIEQLDLSSYDLIISSSYAVAKGVLIAPGQHHICYCHSPMRYAWDLQHSYLQGQRKLLTRYLLHRLRLWDVLSANRVDYFLANSQFIAQRIEKFYRRPARVVYPPVALPLFPLQRQKQDYYVTTSRLVSYKRVDLIVEAFCATPARKLVVIGTGPEEKRLKHLASPNIVFTGHLPPTTLATYLGGARAFVYAALEDFGITPLEAQACGTPLIAFGQGGVKETCAATAEFFEKQTAHSLCEAIQRFESRPPPSPEICRQNAERFSSSNFCETFLNEIKQCLSNVSF